MAMTKDPKDLEASKLTRRNDIAKHSVYTAFAVIASVALDPKSLGLPEAIADLAFQIADAMIERSKKPLGFKYLEGLTPKAAPLGQNTPRGPDSPKIVLDDHRN